MVAVELVADRATKAPFDPTQKVVGRVKAECESRGLFTRVVRDILLLAPPLVITGTQVDRIVDIVREAVRAVLPTACDPQITQITQISGKERPGQGPGRFLSVCLTAFSHQLSGRLAADG